MNPDFQDSGESWVSVLSLQRHVRQLPFVFYCLSGTQKIFYEESKTDTASCASLCLSAFHKNLSKHCHSDMHACKYKKTIARTFNQWQIKCNLGCLHFYACPNPSTVAFVMSCWRSRKLADGTGNDIAWRYNVYFSQQKRKRDIHTSD